LRLAPGVAELKGPSDDSLAPEALQAGFKTCDARCIRLKQASKVHFRAKSNLPMQSNRNSSQRKRL
jgi:hypothetical protein